tara:strand:+ start:33712 stop:34851 length:1140 start_codon:yes stop_codon:yes gene_type:complete
MKQLSYIFILVFTLNSCSTLNFWSSDEEDFDEPRSLQEIKEEKDINVLWSRNLKSNNELGNFNPGFFGDSISIIDENGVFRSFNRLTGKPLTKIKLEKNVSTSITIGFGKFVFSDLDGIVYCYDLDSFNLLWDFDSGAEVLASPAIDAKAVVIHNSAGELIAIDTNNGQKMWSYRSQLPNLTIRGNSVPVIIDDQVYASFDNGRLNVFNLDSGYSLWGGPISYKEGSSELENLIDADSSPIIQNNFIFAVNYQGNITAFDNTQKRPIWNYKASSFHSPLFVRGVLVVAQDTGSILSFSANTLQESWENEEYLRRSLSNPISLDGNIYVGDIEGYIHIINPLNGRTIGRKKITRQPIKSIFKRGSVLYVLDANLRLIAIS